MHESEEGLLEGVRNRGRGIENFLEALVDELRRLQRMVDRAVDAYRDAPQPAAGLRVGEVAVRY